MTIQTVTVLGAGTMGAAIAGVLADAGLHVHLLDLPAPPDEETFLAPPGVTPAQVARNGPAWSGLERMRTLRPPNLYHEQSLARIQPGNLEDDLEAALGASDWIIEAVVEDLQIKQELLARVAEHTPAHAIVSSNTSGLPIHLLCQDLPSGWSQRFLGTHFFNPPRYLPLLELIPHAGTDPDTVHRLQDFATRRLGRETVVCRDSPYFIGNRVFAFMHQITLNTAVDLGLTVHEVDQLTGTLVGRPRAATFRLCDIIGLDVMQLVCDNLYDLIPDDPFRQVYRHAGSLRILDCMLQSQLLGNKTRQGFYQVQQDTQGQKTFLGLDLAAAQEGHVQYLAPQTLQEPRLAALATLPLPERFRQLMALDSVYGQFLWEIYGRSFTYLSHIAGEIAPDAYAVDRALHWGFHWQMGLFELWDALGLETTRQRLARSGFTLGPWIPDTEQGFHQSTGTRRTAYGFDGIPVPVAASESYHGFQDIQQRSQALDTNEAATLCRGQDDILYLEIHSPQGIIDRDLLDLCQEAVHHLHGQAQGLIITRNDETFSAGANLKQVRALLDEGDWSTLETMARYGQDTFMALRLAPNPVAVAMRGLALGGGLELMLAADCVVPYREAQLGLVETAVGIVPGWGGCKELVRRWLQPRFIQLQEDPGTALSHLLQQIGLAKVSRHAAEARDFGYLAPDTPIIGRPSQMLAWAEREIRRQHDLGYQPPTADGTVYAAGADGKANLAMANYLWHEGGYMSDHDLLVTSKLVHVLCGGDLDRGTWMDEQYFLDLEREAVLSLLGEAKTRDRIEHMLATGKPLRN